MKEKGAVGEVVVIASLRLVGRRDCEGSEMEQWGVSGDGFD